MEFSCAILKFWKVVLLLTAAFLPSSPCGYESCPQVKPGYLNVHLVPHSHDDMGWLKTVDQYYYGANNSIQMASVQYILDSVVDQLTKDPKRRFIYVETGFFWRWWTNQGIEKQNLVKNLVTSGQLEFINGGWCMNDEATAHYNEIIDQMSLGLRFLNTTFGSCGIPRVAWQIDPFGHSREQASLFARMGFDGLFFGRLDYQDKEFREIKKSMEMIWSGSPKNLGKSAWLFTGALYHGYNPPDGFCWDINCSDDPIMDDPKLLGYNLDEEIQKFINATLDWASVYQTNHILMTMGSDFQFMAARTWYKNLDKLMNYINAHSDQEDLKLNLIYSTPSCYLKEVNKARPPLEIKRDDFFPYASNKHSFWTGYFTSRPALKYYIHHTNNFLQVCKQFGATGDFNSANIEKVFKLAEAIAVAQHHDAIAGTAKQHVTFDYALRLNLGIQACEEVIGSRIKQLLRKKAHQRQNSEENLQESTNKEARSGTLASANEIPLPRTLIESGGSTSDIQFCHELNISSCPASEKMTDFLLHIYNPLARELVKPYFRIPLTADSWEITGPQGDVLSAQVIPLPNPIYSIPGRNSSANVELVLQLEKIPPLSIQTLQISRLHINDIVRSASSLHSNDYRMRKTSGKISFSNNKGVEMTLDEDTGLLCGISQKSGESKVEVKLSQNFYFYAGMNGTNESPESQPSGAYIFRPNGSDPNPISARATYTIHRGSHVTEIHQTFTGWVSQVIRLYEDSQAIEFEYLIGPIPITDNIGKEVITKYTSDLKTEGIFYTDANGRELLKRERNIRPTWEYKMYEPVAGNYYPVNSRMILTEWGSEPDARVGKTLILLNDRTQGGSSINDGEIELMLHRRLLVDDGFGVGEALNETAYGQGLVIRGKHWLVLAGQETGVPTSIHRSLAQKIYRSAVLTFQENSGRVNQNETLEDTNEIVQNMKALPTLDLTLPDNIHLLTYERLSEFTSLLRLEHFYENGEDAILSKKAFIPVQTLKDAFGFQSLRETTLGSNSWKNESHRMSWTPTEDQKLTVAETSSRILSYEMNDAAIEFQPMEIKSFILFFH